MKGRIITGIIFLTIVLFAMACKTCDAQTRKEKRQLEKLKCECRNEARFFDNGEVNIIARDSTVWLRVGRRHERYFFKDCNRVGPKEYYEISDGRVEGFIVLSDFSVYIELVTVYGSIFRGYVFAKDNEGQVIVEPR